MLGREAARLLCCQARRPVPRVACLSVFRWKLVTREKQGKKIGIACPQILMVCSCELVSPMSDTTVCLQLPTFKHGDIVINESMAIVDYLEVSPGSSSFFSRWLDSCRENHPQTLNVSHSRLSLYEPEYLDTNDFPPFPGGVSQPGDTSAARRRRGQGFCAAASR